VTRRRPPKPGPGRDFRALADIPPQRGLPLPAAEPVNADTGDATDDVELRVRRAPDGSLYALLTAAVTLRDAATVRRLAKRLHDAADALDGGAS